LVNFLEINKGSIRTYNRWIPIQVSKKGKGNGT